MITITYPDSKTATVTLIADVSAYLAIVNGKLAAKDTPVSVDNAALGVDLAAADLLIAALQDYKAKRVDDASNSTSKTILTILEKPA